MATRKVAITIEDDLLREVDRWVDAGEYPNRSRAIQAAVKRLHDRKDSLLRELVKLQPADEHALAEEWLDAESEWPEY